MNAASQEIVDQITGSFVMPSVGLTLTQECVTQSGDKKMRWLRTSFTTVSNRSGKYGCGFLRAIRSDGGMFVVSFPYGDLEIEDVTYKNLEKVIKPMMREELEKFIYVADKGKLPLDSFKGDPNWVEEA